MALERAAAMTLHQLHVFATVAHEGSFVRAAEVLLISVPSVSGQVKSLERVVGARLLERSPGRRGVSVSDAGAILLRCYDELELALENGLREIQMLQRGEGGSIVFGASLSFGGYAFPRLYEAFHRTHAAIDVNLEIGNRAEVLEGLRRGRLDLGVVLGPVDVPKLVVEPFGPDVQVVLVGPAGHPLATTGVPAPFRALAAEQLVLPGEVSPISQAVDRLAAVYNTSLHIAWRLGNIEAQSQAIASGVGIGATILDAVAQRLASGQLALLHVEGFPVLLEQCLMHRRGHLSTAAQAFRQFLLEDRGS
jgi:LysR family transcriptional regulator, low CO2-responsive transcriptional regulator